MAIEAEKNPLLMGNTRLCAAQTGLSFAGGAGRPASRSEARPHSGGLGHVAVRCDLAPDTNTPRDGSAAMEEKKGSVME